MLRFTRFSDDHSKLEITIQFFQIEFAYPVTFQEIGVSWIADLHLLKHLTYDHFDMLIINSHALKSVNFLNFIDQICLNLRCAKKTAKAGRPAAIKFTKVNAVIGASGIVTLTLGYWLLAEGSITAAPILLVLAYIVLLPMAIIR